VTKRNRGKTRLEHQTARKVGRPSAFDTMTS
jgi:hypothetical protein